MKYNVGKFFELFEGHILKRGYNCFLENKVLSMETIEDLKFIFFVEGTKNYEVEIVLNESGVHTMSCDCPYAELKNCKHMAAVLYALKEGFEIKGRVLKEVHNMSDFELFKLNVLEGITTYNYSEFYDDYEYYGDDNEVFTISNYGLDEVSNIIDSEEYEFAMQAILFLYEICLDGNIADNLYNADEFITKLNDLLSLIISAENAYNVLVKLITLNKGYYFEKIIYEVCKAANNQELNKKCITIIEEFSDFEIEKSQKDSVIFDLVLLNDYEKAREMLFKYKDEGMLAVMLEYLSDDLLKSIEIIEKFFDYNIYEYEYFYEYIAMCQKAGLDDKCYGSLIGHVMETGSFTSYECLMDFTNFEREKKGLEDAIMRNGDIYDKVNLCLLYKQYNHLFALCKSRFHLIEQHFDLLKSDYGEELIAIYKERIVMVCKDGASKHNYKLICRFILRMAQIEDSREDVIEIIEYIKEKYSRRAKLLEELKFIEATVV